MNRNIRLIPATRMFMSVGRAILSIVIALYLAALGFSSLGIGALFLGVTFASALMSLAGAGGGNVEPYQLAESAFIAEDVPTENRVDAFGRVAFTSVLGGCSEDPSPSW